MFLLRYFRSFFPPFSPFLHSPHFSLFRPRTWVPCLHASANTVSHLGFFCERAAPPRPRQSRHYTTHNHPQHCTQPRAHTTAPAHSAILHGARMSSGGPPRRAPLSAVPKRRSCVQHVIRGPPTMARTRRGGAGRARGRGARRGAGCWGPAWPRGWGSTRNGRMPRCDAAHATSVSAEVLQGGPRL